MSSLQGFYVRITSPSLADSVVVHVRIDASHEVYKGHFPDQPVAPGAALTQMVIDEAARMIGASTTFIGAKQVKFLSVLDPTKTQELELHYTFVERDGGYQFACTGKNAETIFFKINGAFG
jgi:3-hydroxyacyl-[acyl-carrier-protein] dehydratase